MTAENLEKTSKLTNRSAEYAYRRGEIIDKVRAISSGELSVACERLLGLSAELIERDVNLYRRKFDHLTRLCEPQAFHVLMEENNGKGVVMKTKLKGYQTIGYVLPLPETDSDPKSEKYLMLLGSGKKKKVVVLEAGNTQGSQKKFNELVTDRNSNTALILQSTINGANPIDSCSDYLSRIGVQTLFSSEKEEDFPEIEKAIFEATSLAESRNMQKRRTDRENDIQEQVDKWSQSISIFEQEMANKNY